MPTLPNCDRCGSRKFTDTLIHDGQSTRRDCADCRRTLGFPLWCGERDIEQAGSESKVKP